MGYDISIIRNGNIDSSDITHTEWLELVDRDAELSNTKKNLEWAIWSNAETGQGHWFEWVDGYVWTKNVDNVILQKMFAIAVELDAQVIGEEGELFHTPDIEYGFTPLVGVNNKVSNSIWQKWRKTIWPYLGLGLLLYVLYRIFN